MPDQEDTPNKLLMDLSSSSQQVNNDCNRDATSDNLEFHEKQFFELSLDYLAIAGFDGSIKRVNPSLLDTFGYHTQELVGYWCIEFVHPEDQIATITQMQKLNAGAAMVNFENRFRCQDGSYRWVMWTNRPVKELGLIYCSGRDITEVKRQESERLDLQKQIEIERIQILEREKAARAQAETANRIKDQFLAVLSHELRSPLNPILGWSNLLKNPKLSEANRIKGLETIERNAKLQIQLIDDLLDVSRILRGKLTLNFDTVDLGDVIEAALETVRSAVEIKQIQLEYVSSYCPVMMLGDVNRLQQIVSNLLTNAVKFTPAGGKVEVLLIPNPKSQLVQIQVRDNGCGIAPEFLPHVFEYFRQADSTTTRQFGGLGLGLAIARNIVEMHGGSIRVESPGEGKGTTFTVTLPLSNDKLDLKNDTSNHMAIELHNLDGVKILAVDDDKDSLDFVRFLLEQYGAVVTGACCASQALAKLEVSKPDILVSDLGMPEVDGYKLIRQIRAMSSHPAKDVPAIALTAYAGDTDRQAVLAAGFQRHVAKPVDAIELVNAICTLLKV